MDKIDQPVDSPGPKEIKILATDKVTNLSQEIYLRYTVDSEPPAVNLELSSIPEQNSKFGKVCEPDTSIRLSAFDFGSGVSRIEFRKLGFCQRKLKNWVNSNFFELLQQSLG